MNQEKLNKLKKEVSQALESIQKEKDRQSIHLSLKEINESKTGVLGFYFVFKSGIGFIRFYSQSEIKNMVGDIKEVIAKEAYLQGLRLNGIKTKNPA